MVPHGLAVWVGMLCANVAIAQFGPNFKQRFEIVAPGNPGGGIDLMARALESTLREGKWVSQPMIIKNMSGAAGDIAKTYVHQHPGDASYLYIESNRIYLNKIVGTTKIGIEDVTPIARLATDYLVWIVRADSPYRNARDILDKLKADPTAVVFGLGATPSNDQMHILRPALSVGIDPHKMRIASFKSGGNLMIQLLGGHVAVISTSVSEAIEQIRAGQVRVLAVSARERLTGEMAQAPTWRSMGVDITILHWRGLFAPLGLAPEVVKFWDDTLGRMVKTDAWKKTLARYDWYDAYADSATFRTVLEQERTLNAQIIVNNLGRVK